MTKKDFELIADIIHNEPDYVTRTRIATAFADRFDLEFVRFNKDKFLDWAIDGN